MLLRSVVAAMLALTVSARAAQTDRQTHTLGLRPNQALSVSVTVGDLQVTGEARDDAIVEVTRTAPGEAGLARIPVQIETFADEIRVAAQQADGGTDPSYRTDVALRVPRSATVSVRIVEGALRLSQLHGSITGDVRRGDIDAATISGTVRLETGIGDVRVRGARLTARGLLRLRAFNGDVRLALAARPADARVMALALNGRIHSDIPLTRKEQWGPRWGEATLGAGAPVISLDVVTGEIHLTVSGG